MATLKNRKIEEESAVDQKKESFCTLELIRFNDHDAVVANALEYDVTSQNRMRFLN